MMYRKQLDRAMQWLREKNKSSEGSPGDSSRDLNREEIDRGDLYLDTKDIIAIILSALMVFGPIILIIIIIAILVYF